jgi:hypothetical protein
VRIRDVRDGLAGERVGLHSLRGRAVFERYGGYGGRDLYDVPDREGLDPDAGEHGE